MDNFHLARMENPQLARSQQTSASRSKSHPIRSKKRPQKKAKSSTSSSAAPKTTKTDSPNWSKILSPKNMEESLTTISTLRNFCKKCIQYVQQADGLLDTLYVTTNSLQESGVLKKLSETKGKNLSSADLTTMLMALMNSPLGNSFFKRLTSGDGGSADNASDTTTTAQNTSPVTNQLPAPAPQSPQVGTLPHNGPAQQGRPRTQGGGQQGPYGYPPGSMPM